VGVQAIEELRVDAADLGAELRERFERIPELVGLSSEHTRLTARFRNGALNGTLKLSANRISASRLAEQAIAGAPSRPDWTGPLEEIAHRLGCTDGDAEIVAEYERTNGTQRLRWVDLVWEMET
jgi:hypothetical protein